MRVILTAGFNQARHVLFLAEGLIEDEVEIAGILVVTPFRLARLASVVQQRGWGSIPDLFNRLVGREERRPTTPFSETLEALGPPKYRSLARMAKTLNIAFKKVPSLNCEKAISFLEELVADCVLYGGGGILRKRFIEAAKGRILNAHSGPLPQVRGMNAAEWTVLLGLNPTVTIHYVDEGIDTGAIVETLPVKFQSGDTIESLRSKCTALGILGLRRNARKLTTKLPGNWSEKTVVRIGLAERQCFILAPALRELLANLLARRKTT